ncbi:uncharacterized protein [Dysidea avara]|uniref:uncharacterized protein n=1 Tax=Dysidea avara TaxID=196820 RepID=UPI003317F5BB
MGITAAKRSHVLDILQRMSYATNEEAYFSAYEELKQTKLKIVLDYFNDNWHEIRDEWVCGLKDENLMFQNHTNNRVESINQKLKSVMSKFARLPQFCRELLKVLSSLHVERDHRAITLFQKTPSQPFPKGSVKSQYMQVVTPFALSYIVKQIDLVSKVKLKPEEGDTYECESSSKIHISASSEDCNCSFRKAMQLPCKHILAVCQKSNFPLFQPALCAERWTLEYYRSSQLILQDQNEHYVFTDGDSIPVSMVTQPKRAVLSQHEKFRKANRITQRLATLASEVSMKDFNSRLACLEEIAKIWERGDHVSVECCDGVESIANDDDLSTVDALDEIANVEDHGANEHHDSDHDDTPDDISIAEENERSAARQDSTNEQSFEISLHDYPEVSQSVTMKQHIQTDPSDATTVVESLDCSGAIDISTVQLPSA